MSDKNINIAHSEFDHVVAALRAYDKALDKEQKETGFVGHEARHAEIVELG